MNAHIPDVQIIRKDGIPLFVVIPYDEYLRLIGETDIDSEPTIPHEVVGLVIKNNWNLLKAWRKHLGLTQAEVAKRAGMSQSALSQLERSDNLRSETLEKLARALGLTVEQLSDI